MTLAPEPAEPTEAQDEIFLVARQSGLAPDGVKNVIAAFAPIYEESLALLATARGIQVKDATYVTEIKRAAETRKAIKKVRCHADGKREELKAESLRYGKGVQNVANFIMEPCREMEIHLEQMEKIGEIEEAKRKAELAATRKELLAMYSADTQFLSLGDMPDEQFASLMEGSRLAFEAKIAAEKKAVADRLAAELARAAEEKRVREENERLRKEAAAKEAEYVAGLEAERKKAKAARAAADAQAKVARDALESKMKAERGAAEAVARKEREAAAAAAKIEREAREKAEAELKAKQDAEKKAAAAQAAAKRKAELAPDSAKLIAFIEAVAMVPAPTVSSPEAAALLKKFVSAIESECLRARSEAQRL